MNNYLSFILGSEMLEHHYWDRRTYNNQLREHIRKDKKDCYSVKLHDSTNEDGRWFVVTLYKGKRETRILNFHNPKFLQDQESFDITVPFAFFAPLLTIQEPDISFSFEENQVTMTIKSTCYAPFQDHYELTLTYNKLIRDDLLVEDALLVKSAAKK